MLLPLLLFALMQNNYVNSYVIKKYFTYPDNVALPIGGGDYEFAAIQMYYNNPNGVQGI